MPVYHISLRCSSPTNQQPDGAYHTIIRVEEPEESLEYYVQQATRRAAILGYGGPHQVVAIQRSDARGWHSVEYGAVERTPDLDARRIRMLDIIEQSMISFDAGDVELPPEPERDTGDAREKRRSRAAYRMRRARPT